MITSPSGGLPTIRASVGGDDHSDGSNCFTSCDRFRRTGVERREHARLAVGVDHRRLLKSRIARELRHVLRALRIPTVLRSYRYLPNPILQPFHRLIVALRNFGLDRSETVFSVRLLDGQSSGDNKETH